MILGGGSHGVAEVVHRGLPKGDAGYFDRAILAQELSAVGAACVLVRRSVYLEVGGSMKSVSRSPTTTLIFA